MKAHSTEISQLQDSLNEHMSHWQSDDGQPGNISSLFGAFDEFQTLRAPVLKFLNGVMTCDDIIVVRVFPVQ